jgi:hypothetical protein
MENLKHKCNSECKDLHKIIVEKNNELLKLDENMENLKHKCNE